MSTSSIAGLSMSSSEGRPPDLSIIIPSWNTLTLTRECLGSLFSNDHGCELEVIVIDNGSADGSPEMVAREFSRAKLIRNPVNEYYSKACNQGAELATADVLCFLNSDTLVPPGSLRKMLNFLEGNQDYGAVAPRLNNPDGSVQPICRRFPTVFEVIADQFDLSRWQVMQRYRASANMRDFDHLSSRDVEQPPGACFMLRSRDFNTLGGFDESLPLFYSDVDICLRLWRSGQRIRFLADAEITHVGSASVVKHALWRAEFMRNQVRYFRKHHGWFAAQFAKSIIIASGVRTAIGTALGRKPVPEKKRLLREVFNSLRIAVSE
ncbi:MAG: glycosyltransferase family 2 protein [Gammaproteobacteria bacterium]|nr:glycosyltransferase family 2 protein [Gammaproteobacteria bacterium]